MKLIKTKDHLLLIDEEAETCKYYLHNSIDGRHQIYSYKGNENNFKRGQSIKWCSKIIAYRPLNKKAKELDLPLLPNPNVNKEVDIEELACNIYGLSLDEYEYIKEDLSQNRALIEEHYRDINREEIPKKYFDALSFICGYQSAQSKFQYSLEDMKKAFNAGYDLNTWEQLEIPNEEREYLNEDEYIQSLSTQQLPKEFIPDYQYRPSTGETTYIQDGWEYNQDGINERKLKTITNSEGKEELVGTYKY